MTGKQIKSSEAWVLANQVSGRYGRLALARAAGEAATAQRCGDAEKTALWSSVVVTLRAAILSAAAAEQTV